ncbi:cell division protein FtsL [Gemella cuniculi]|uniref:cell division protein FtsL n=1 Tax=Gemella cuniculi TaxID=150240 RepID=UPI0003F70A81|nr:cell division protein FtsL [Gemella cuniculi]
MATLKVYSREYGVRKVQEKVKFNLFEKAGYGIFVGVILLANIVMLNYKGELYSLKSTQQKNDVVISEKQKDNNEQKVIINNLSSYERVKKIAESLGMKTQKDNIKVVR